MKTIDNALYFVVSKKQYANLCCNKFDHEFIMREEHTNNSPNKQQSLNFQELHTLMASY